MIQLKNKGFDRGSLSQALNERTIKKLVIPTSSITIYSLSPHIMPDDKDWMFTRIDSNAIERLNNNQKLFINRVSTDSLPAWSKKMLVNTGFFISVSTKEEEMQFFVEKNSVSTLMKFLNLSGRAFVKSRLVRDLMMKSEMDEQNPKISLIYREEKQINSYGDQITYRSVIAFRNEKFDISHQMERLKTAVLFWEKKGAVIDKWIQDQEKISVRMILPQIGKNLFQEEYSLPARLVPCITLRDSESGDVAFQMQTAVVNLAGTTEIRKDAIACRIGELIHGKAKQKIILDDGVMENIYNEAYHQFCDYASTMHAMQNRRISPAGNADDNGKWKFRNMKQLKDYISSALKVCECRKTLGTKRRDIIEKRLISSLNPEKIYTEADIAILFLKIPMWICKDKCNETVLEDTTDSLTKFVMIKEAA